jgi:hypothetical protein
LDDSASRRYLAMTVAVPPRSQIHKTIDQLRPEQLAQLRELVELLTTKADEAPLYRSGYG